MFRFLIGRKCKQNKPGQVSFISVLSKSKWYLKTWAMEKTCRWLMGKDRSFSPPPHTRVSVDRTLVSIERLHLPVPLYRALVPIPLASILTCHSETLGGFSGCILESTAAVTPKPGFQHCQPAPFKHLHFVIYCFVKPWQDSCLCVLFFLSREKEKKKDDRRPHSDDMQFKSENSDIKHNSWDTSSLQRKQLEFAFFFAEAESWLPHIFLKNK